jgi:glycosyltransferase involved in cell wall biosynthesis
MKILFSKFSDWDLDSYTNKHPESVAIYNIINKTAPKNNYILVGDGTRYEHFCCGDVHFYNFSLNNKFLYLFSTLVKAELFIFQRPKIVVSMGIINSLPFGLLSLFTRSRFIALITGEVWYSMQTLPRVLKKIHCILLKLMFDRANMILVLSESISKELVADYNINPKKIAVTKYKISDMFNSSVTKELKKELNPNGPIILTVCRISSVKGLEYLVYAAKEIIKEFPASKIIIKGYTSEEDYKHKIEQLIKTNNLDKQIVMLDGSPNVEIAKYMAAADVFVLSSISEGLGVVILEALSTGLPVVATNVGGIVDIINSGNNGLLVNARDSEALAKAIIQVLSDNKLREQLIAGGLETIKRLNENKTGLEQDLVTYMF